MNKKAMLLAEETLKIVLALIAIGFLVYFLVSLWMANQDAKDLELAKASLQHLVDEINAESPEIEIYNPKAWFVLSWPHTTTSGVWLWKSTNSGVPKSCENLGWANCICICDGNDQDDCDKMGICLGKKFIVKGDFIKIKPVPLNLEIKYNNNEIIITK